MVPVHAKFSSSNLEKWRLVNQSLLLSSQIVREIDVRALVLQNHPKSIRTSARTSISRTSASKCEFKKIITQVITNKLGLDPTLSNF
jgi:hypothetical protein